MKRMNILNNSKQGSIFSKRGMVLILLAVLVAFFSITARNFFTLNNFTNLLRQTSIIGIMSVGLAFVMIAAGLDLSIGSMIAMVGCITAISIVRAGIPIWISILIGMSVALAISTVSASLILVTNMPPFICTLAMLQILQGLAYMITNATPVYGLPDVMRVIGQGYVWFIPVPVIIMVVCFIIGGFMLNRTYLGRYLYAVGGNSEAARLSGLNVNKIKLVSYIMCGAFVGIAGIVMMSRIFSGQPRAGAGYELDVITACVVGGVAFSGGKGTIGGLVQGVLVMGVLSNGLGVRGVDSYTQLVFKGVVLVLVVGIDCFQQTRVQQARMKIKTSEKDTEEIAAE